MYWWLLRGTGPAKRSHWQWSVRQYIDLYSHMPCTCTCSCFFILMVMCLLLHTKYPCTYKYIYAAVFLLTIVMLYLSCSGVDDILPIMSYVIIRSGLPQLVSETALMEDFIQDGWDWFPFSIISSGPHYPILHSVHTGMWREKRDFVWRHSWLPSSLCPACPADTPSHTTDLVCGMNTWASEWYLPFPFSTQLYSSHWLLRYVKYNFCVIWVFVN